MTLAELRNLLAPYADGDEIVFVDADFNVCGVVGIAKDHGTTARNPGGSVSMPVAVYLDEGVKGKPGVMGGADPETTDLLRGELAGAPAALTVAKLLQAADGLDPDAPVIVGIINGPRFNAAYADQEVCGGTLSLYICCYEEPRDWEGTPPTPSGDGTATLEYDPDDDAPKSDPEPRP